ncbi:MAG: hypothetical protein WDN67_04600 [Candidatus Moraniibacteriota bacterium]
MRSLVFLFLFIGSTLGGFVPLLWGGSAFSVSSVLWSGIGGVLGIALGYHLGRSL